MYKYGMDSLQLYNVTKIELLSGGLSIWIGDEENPSYSDLNPDETMIFFINAAYNPLND
jgi:hypothetical protein